MTIVDVAISMAAAESLLAASNRSDHRGFVIAEHRGPNWRNDSFSVSVEDVARLIERDQALAGAVGVRPARSGFSPDEFRTALTSPSFVAAHLAPDSYGVPPDDPRWYPAYTICDEVGIPVEIEVGVRPLPGPRRASVGRPIALDAVAADFPDLTIIALGAWPWVDEAISMAYKHTNVYLAIGVDGDHRHDPALVRFADSWGRDKVVFASYGSDPFESVARLGQLGLRDESLEAVTSRNALRIFAGLS